MGLTTEQAREREAAARAMVRALCTPRGEAGAREWVMSIPARPDHDPDLVIAAALDALGDMTEWREVYHPDAALWQQVYAAACGNEGDEALGRFVRQLAVTYYQTEVPRVRALAEKYRDAGSCEEVRP